MSASVESSYLYCEKLARRAARNFYYGFRLLPRPKRLALCALYAYMRRVDDLADAPAPDGGPEARRRALADWRERTTRVLGGEANPEPLWPALVDTLGRYRIPPQLLFDVVNGAEMDLEGRTYPHFDDLRVYCYHVAGAVGRICTHVFGYSEPRALELAEQMGIAFQLTNILRDVKRDYEIGRVYLPAEDLERFGCQPGELARESAPGGALAELLRFQAQRAWRWYEEAWALLPLIEADSRRALWALARIYSGLLEEIERRRFDVFSRPARLSTAEKLAILFWARWGPAGTDEFRHRDRSWRGLGWALLRHRAR